MESELGLAFCKGDKVSSIYFTVSSLVMGWVLVNMWDLLSKGSIAEMRIAYKSIMLMWRLPDILLSETIYLVKWSSFKTRQI